MSAELVETAAQAELDRFEGIYQRLHGRPLDEAIRTAFKIGFRDGARWQQHAALAQLERDIYQETQQ